MKFMLERNARLQGTENCLIQTMEECGELIQACNKVLRASGKGQPTDISYHDALAKLREELVDVRIMSDELIYLLCLDDEKQMSRLRLEKVNRTFHRLVGDGVDGSGRQDDQQSSGS